MCTSSSKTLYKIASLYLAGEDAKSQNPIASDLGRKMDN